VLDHYLVSMTKSRLLAIVLALFALFLISAPLASAAGVKDPGTAPPKFEPPVDATIPWLGKDDDLVDPGSDADCSKLDNREAAFTSTAKNLKRKSVRVAKMARKHSKANKRSKAKKLRKAQARISKKAQRFKGKARTVSSASVSMLCVPDDSEVEIKPAVCWNIKKADGKSKQALREVASFRNAVAGWPELSADEKQTLLNLADRREQKIREKMDTVSDRESQVDCIDDDSREDKEAYRACEKADWKLDEADRLTDRIEALGEKIDEGFGSPEKLQFYAEEIVNLEQKRDGLLASADEIEARFDCSDEDGYEDGSEAYLACEKADWKLDEADRLTDRAEDLRGKVEDGEISFEKLQFVVQEINKLEQQAANLYGSARDIQYTFNCKD